MEQQKCVFRRWWSRAIDWCGVHFCLVYQYHYLSDLGEGRGGGGGVKSTCGHLALTDIKHPATCTRSRYLHVYDIAYRKEDCIYGGSRHFKI